MAESTCTESLKWNLFGPPHIGWWIASNCRDWNVWRWWNGSTWSLPVGPCEGEERAADYGPKWRASLAKYDHVSFTWKTVQLSLFGDSELSSVTWPISGMTAGGQCWELPMSAGSTSATASGLLPTPRASMSSHGIAWCRARTGKHKGNLEDFLAHQHLARGGVEVSGLNVSPSYCEFLMIWPMGWTDLKPLEMAKFQEWQQQHGHCST